MSIPDYIPFKDYKEYSPEETIKRSEDFYSIIRKRRTIRSFSSKPIPFEVIKNCILSAGTSPSGANMQPWHFVVVTNLEVKRKIRIGAEQEEHEFYTKRAPKEWLAALAPLGTDEHKSFLEQAPYLIVIFSKSYDLLPDGKKVKQYYSLESTGIACGILITAIHNAGLVSLTHTPSPMGFLNEILNRPLNEEPFLILVAGYPAEDAKVPVINKKSLDEIMTFI
jgi:nitroreductase